MGYFENPHKYAVPPTFCIFFPAFYYNMRLVRCLKFQEKPVRLQPPGSVPHIFFFDCVMLSHWCLRFMASYFARVSTNF